MNFKIFKSIAFLALLAGVHSSELYAKIGIIDMQAVILNVQEGKDARATIEKEIKAKEGEFTKRREELDKMNKDWQGQASLMSDEAKLNKQKEFQEKFMSLRNDEGAFREEVK
jgi:outer membrane protein